MKKRIVVSFVTSLIALAAARAGAEPARTKVAEPAKVKVADKPSPAKKAPAKAAKKTAKRPKPSYWLASTPHVPLATVKGSDIRSVGARGKTCGSKSRWAKAKSRWKAVDAWGQVTGTFEIGGSELYDVTRCHEVFFNASTRAGAEGSGLFVSEDSGFTAPTSAAWKPASAEAKRYEAFLGAQEEAWVDAKPSGKPLANAKRTMFFQLPKEPNMGIALTPKRPVHWAVSGGPILVVAYLGEQGKWKVAKVRPPLGLSDSYKPVAVFDMNGDGLPEIVVHESDGPSYGDSVLSFDPGSLTWEDVAESPGGATI